MEPEIPALEIFRGQSGDTDVVLIEIVEGRCTACDSMLQLAAEKSGPYFLFSSETHLVLLRIDTSQPSVIEE